MKFARLSQFENRILKVVHVDGSNCAQLGFECMARELQADMLTTAVTTLRCGFVIPSRMGGLSRQVLKDPMNVGLANGFWQSNAS